MTTPARVNMASFDQEEDLGLDVKEVEKVAFVEEGGAGAA
jgi:hypothetical protein